MKFFSVEGAERLIPALEGFVLQLHRLKGKILQKQLQIDAILIAGKASEPSSYASNQEAVQKDVQSLNLLVKEFNGILDEINALGAQLKDPDLGLVDFYHIRNDDIVLLCWKFGEKKVEHWHTLQSGFSSREKI